MRAVFFAIGRAFSSFWRRSFVTFLSIGTITIALVILGAFAMITFNLRGAIGNIKRQIQLEFYLAEGTTKADVSELISEIETENGVESVEFVTAERARMGFIEEFGDELLKGLPGNPFPPSIRIELSQAMTMDEAVGNLTEKYGSHRSITDLSAPNKIAHRLAGASRITLVLTFAWGIILLFAATLIITNTVRLAISQRAESIKIMQLVGASRSFVRLPFLFEGILHGLLSGGLAWLVLTGLYEATAYIIPGLIPLYIPVKIAIVALGGVLGGLGSAIALRKYLRY